MDSMFCDCLYSLYFFFVITVFFCFFPCNPSRYCQKFSQAELKWYPLIWYLKQKICCSSTFNAVVLYFYHHLSDNYFDLSDLYAGFFFRSFIITCLIFMFVTYSFFFLKACSCPVHAIQITRKFIWQVDIISER